MKIIDRIGTFYRRVMDDPVGVGDATRERRERRAKVRIALGGGAIYAAFAWDSPPGLDYYVMPLWVGLVWAGMLVYLLWADGPRR